ncbi:type IV-A pilus assembly ATPase PilB [Pyrinomonas methylaliphatogenes]|jgi:type IV pilus assembly protein PilB|uniref:Type IV-A pilus assembly ATPase PilB n=1 Tax=Pyrinomonas methylaliphatogenes TaxID=454194 RepID=A0A0B6WWF3_9BACT|nr:type IV-A pilus assembly ATPase PilB [Pyrinomonas methylaliphatogenes]MBX5479547.1 type IV-A pilus assembly ATPase PilB [Pyrinomonas methylaliphatogenes]CDM65588.1 type IV-A pilus assembly ATPase PilB [Pyrinomonas methylaliphatogenes]
MSAKLGEILVREKILTPQQLREALDYQREHGGRLGYNLVKLGFVSDDMITAVLSRLYGVPSINLDLFEIDPQVIKLIPREVAEKYSVLPLSRVGATLTLAMADPTNVFAMDDIKFMTGLNVEPVIVSEASLQEAIEKYYSSSREIELAERIEPGGGRANGNGHNAGGDLLSLDQLNIDLGEELGEGLELVQEEDEIDMSNLERMSEEAPVVRLVNAILVDALRRGASDIHVEPYEKEFRVRFRIDGVLYDVLHPPLKLRDALISRLKIMAKLDISEKRLPQDGRIKLKIKADGRSRELDFRVSTLPTLFGEKVVLRILDKERLMLDMTKLGFEPESLVKFQRAINKPYGMVLVTGPTGSGKTNTLYSAIQALNKPETNIMTAEDPVEFNLPGINQVQIKEQIGLNFAAALRAFLRQDPNIILVGEIRDFETAEIAIKAALTGHLVLSTLHTNDAPSTISRLMNMGIEPFLVATSVNLIQAQRLVRRICEDCRVECPMPPEALIEVGFSPEEARQIKTYKGRGCRACNGTGYRGRIGLYEVMEMTDELRELILVGASALELRRKAIEDGMITLRESGLHKIRNGITTVEEVVRETVA